MYTLYDGASCCVWTTRGRQVLLREAGRTEEARALFRRGVAAAPRYAALWQAIPARPGSARARARPPYTSPYTFPPSLPMPTG